MNRFFKKIARRIVTAEANRTYKKAIKMANERYENEGKRVYVIENPSDPTRLMLITSDEHCAIRHRLGITSKQQPISQLKSQCWYYTKNGSGKDPIPADDLVIRRLAFVRDRLDAAGLIGE